MNEVMTKIEFKFPAEFKKFAEEEGDFHIIGYAATTDFDLQGDIITEEALKGSSLDLLKNSTVLLNHDLKKPIGKVTRVEFDKNGLLIDVLISKTEPEMIQKVKEGVLNKFSIRGQVLERESKYMPELDRVVNVIKRMNLIEVSIVSVPANPQARAIGWYISKAINESEKNKEVTMENESDVIIEEINNPEQEKPQNTELKTTETKPAEANEKEKPQDEFEQMRQKKPNEMEKGFGIIQSQLEPVFLLLDKIISKGGEQAVFAQQIKVMLKTITDSSYPYPSAYPEPKSLSKDEVGKLVSDEVKKQISDVMKNIPTLRKGLIQNEVEARELKKQFETLPPDKKLRALLSMEREMEVK
mgnify:CR=1 FL=1